MLLTNKSSLVLWHDVVKGAESRCSITLKYELETYLISLLMRYTNKPEIIKQILATAFLEALHQGERERNASLQHVGDQCLLFAGLFPHLAKKKLVKITYFVDLGRSAYSIISQRTNDVFSCLAFQFVDLIDILQSIRPTYDLLPLEAYDQWNEIGSQKAFNTLKISGGLPVKFIKE